MREWMKTIALGAALALMVAAPAIAQEGGDDGSPQGPAEHTVQATEQEQHQWGPGPAAQPTGDLERDRDRDRDRDGTCADECPCTSEQEQNREREQVREGRSGDAPSADCSDRDRLRLRDGTCTASPEAECSADRIRDRLRSDTDMSGCEMQLLMRCCLPSLGLLPI